MRAKYFDRGLGSFNVMADFRAKRLHVVCVAVNALTFYNAFAVDVANGISTEEAQAFADTVNNHNEVGTLWPKFAMTLIPLTRWKDRNDVGDHDVMSRHIRDAFLANREYVKCNEIVFAFEQRDDFDAALATEVLLEEAAAMDGDQFLQQVFYIPG
jgi:hypothetical protein